MLSHLWADALCYLICSRRVVSAHLWAEPAACQHRLLGLLALVHGIKDGMQVLQACS